MLGIAIHSGQDIQKRKTKRLGRSKAKLQDCCRCNALVQKPCLCKSHSYCGRQNRRAFDPPASFHLTQEMFPKKKKIRRKKRKKRTRKTRKTRKMKKNTKTRGRRIRKINSTRCKRKTRKEHICQMNPK